MPYVPGDFDGAHLYLQWGGKLPGNETWSCGLRMATTSGAVISPNDQNAMITACKTAIQAFHTRVGTGIGPGAKLSFVKLNAISANGAYSIDTTTQQVVADVAGGGVETFHPNQVAWALTLETGYSRGPAHRGRIYLPLPGISVQADGLVQAADATALKTSAGTLLTALNAAQANYKVAVFSRKNPGATHRLVTGFAVGRALDTQRRRRRSLIENYV